MSASAAVVGQIVTKPASAGFTNLSGISAVILGLSKKYRSTDSSANSLDEEFLGLADRWRRNTQFFSSVSDMVLDPSYQQIIGKGAAIIPSILRELKNGADHWYWALGAITQENPAKDTADGDIEAICQAWLDWGKARGLVR